MKEKDPNEMNEETRARSQAKLQNQNRKSHDEQKKRAKKATAEASEPDALENYLKLNIYGLKKMKSVRASRKRQKTWLKAI
jgi:hypothetical protein